LFPINAATFIASVIAKSTYYAKNFTFVIKLLSANEDVSIVFLLVKANGSPAWKEQYGDASVIRRNTVTN